MTCTIKWNSLNISEWEQRFNLAPRPALLQSYAYARAACAVQGQKARWGLIEIDGQEAGLVQMLEAGIAGNLLHMVAIDRGPVWLEGFGTQDHFTAFLEQLNRAFPHRTGRMRRLIPEIKDNSNIKEMILKHGFKRKNIPGYQTLWLNLDAAEDQLLSGLNAKWRGRLNKARRSGLALDWDDGTRHLPGVLQGYVLDRAQKGYPGPSVKLLQALGQSFEKNMVIGRALIDNKVCAATVFLCHGLSATYQVGWTTEAGRERAAHHLLLWESLRILKTKGIKNLDLGGVNDESAAGVKQFKIGMGGELAVLPGLYT